MHLKVLLLRQKQSCRDLWILQGCAATYITIKHIDQSSDWSAGAYEKRKREGSGWGLSQRTKSRRPPLPSASLNQFSMCQALQTEPSRAPASKTLAVSEWRSGHRICRLPPGWQGIWQRAPTRWQHVAKLQSCQTVNVSMTTNCSTVVRGADEPTNQCKSVAFRKPQAASLGGEHPTDN